MTTNANIKPVLIYDGDCGICLYWVNYWQGLTGDSVEYRPYQVVAGNYPDISLDEFRRSIQFISPDGEVSSGAKAVYVLLKDHLPYNFYLLLEALKGRKPLEQAISEAYPGKWRSLSELEAAWEQSQK